jgi:predicted transcriptional regulator
MKMLKRHLSTDHGLSPAEYRARWGLPASYPMVAQDYAQKRAELAVKIGLGRKRKTATTTPAGTKPEPARKPGRPRKKLSPAYDGGEG